MLKFYKNKLRTIIEYVYVLKDWHKVTFPFNKFFRGPQTLHLRNGAIVTIPSVFSYELGQVISFFYHDEYRLGDIKLPPHPIIFDLGANIGLFTVGAKRHYPNASITSYEPHPVTFELLKMNAPFAKVLQRAAAGKSGVVEFQDDGKSIERKIISEGGIKVPADNLNEILAEVDHVDLLKVDIEGAEFELFENASNSTIGKIQNLIIEVHGEDTGEFVYNKNGKRYPKLISKNHWVEDFFRPRGFKIRWIEDWGVAHVWKD